MSIHVIDSLKSIIEHLEQNEFIDERSDDSFVASLYTAIHCIERLEVEAHEADTLREQVATLTAELNHFRKRLVETDTEASEARADVERLTKEADHLRKLLAEERGNVGAHSARHLAAIETLRAFAERMKQSSFYHEAVEALGDTADYAKKADEAPCADCGYTRANAHDLRCACHCHQKAGA